MYCRSAAVMQVTTLYYKMSNPISICLALLTCQHLSTTLAATNKRGLYILASVGNELVGDVKTYCIY